MQPISSLIGKAAVITEATKQLMTLARKLDQAFAAGDIERAKLIAAKQNAVIDAVIGERWQELMGEETE
jgi:hypothetical protein